jgi:hypothetical protein
MQARHHAKRQARPLACGDDLLQQGRVRGGHGDDQQLGSGLAGDLSDLGDGAEDGHAMHLAAAQALGIVQEADRLVGADAVQVADQRLARLSGAKDQDPRGQPVKVTAAFLPCPVQQPRCPQQADQAEGIQQEHRAWNGLQPVVEEQADDDADRAHRTGDHQVAQVGDAREAPQSAVQAHPPQDEPLDGQHDGVLHRPPRASRHASQQRIPQGVQPVPAEPDHREVVQHHCQARQPRRPSCPPWTHSLFPCTASTPRPCSSSQNADPAAYHATHAVASGNTCHARNSQIPRIAIPVQAAYASVTGTWLPIRRAQRW